MSHVIMYRRFVVHCLRPLSVYCWPVTWTMLPSCNHQGTDGLSYTSPDI